MLQTLAQGGLPVPLGVGDKGGEKRAHHRVVGQRVVKEGRALVVLRIVDVVESVLAEHDFVQVKIGRAVHQRQGGSLQKRLVTRIEILAVGVQGDLRTAGAVGGHGAFHLSVVVTHVGKEGTVHAVCLAAKALGYGKLIAAEAEVGVRKLGVIRRTEGKGCKLGVIVEVVQPRHEVVVPAPHAVAEVRRELTLALAIGVVEVEIPEIFKIILLLWQADVGA